MDFPAPGEGDRIEGRAGLDDGFFADRRLVADAVTLLADTDGGS